MDLMQKLTILADGAKYDAACTSSGSNRSGGKGLGNTVAAGCCHSFSEDGRCISLLKVLMTNVCIYDCKYCVNRSSNDIPRAAFTPEELSELTVQFYRRNYIEGLFLSSGVIKSPDYTTELMIRTLELLRVKHSFWGYIHAKAIPGASSDSIARLGGLADRLSVNIELPSESSLISLAPHKTKSSIMEPMTQIAKRLNANEMSLVPYGGGQRFAPAGHATQMIIGASPETDYQILMLSDGLYKRFGLKRVFFSAYIPVVEHSLLPSLQTKPPLLREHRLYQADWLMRFYKFKASEILNEQNPHFNPFLDPKCNWAVHNMDFFPVDVNKANLDELLRVPGIGPRCARYILKARKASSLGLSDLKGMGVVLKRAQYFIINKDTPRGMMLGRERTISALIYPGIFKFGMEQLSFFNNGGGLLESAVNEKNMVSAVEEAVLCLESKL